MYLLVLELLEIIDFKGPCNIFIIIILDGKTDENIYN